jgi:hypothetical protein
LTQLQNWVTTYEPMIQTLTPTHARIQHQLNQQILKYFILYSISISISRTLVVQPSCSNTFLGLKAMDPISQQTGEFEGCIRKELAAKTRLNSNFFIFLCAKSLTYF